MIKTGLPGMYWTMASWTCGFSNMDPIRISSRSKKLGFQEGIRANFGDDMPYYIYENVSADMTGGFGAMMKALHEHPDIDGVICSMDILACGALQAIRESGRVVPRDISVIGVDNSEFAETCYPRLTSLDNMIIESSVEISTRVISNLEGSPSSVRKIMLFTRIMERDTT